MKILLVEDHESTASLLERLLTRSRHEVSTATTVQDAVALLRRERFDLMISDLGLPDGSGLDILPALDGDHGPRRAIALSGYGMDQDRAASHAAGFNAHLTKPVDLRQLEQTIATVTSN